jgi:hypothetical protein
MFLGNVGLFLDYAGVTPGIQHSSWVEGVSEQNTEENVEVFT